MGSTAASAANMGHHMGACAVPDSKPMQFPLAQRRKRRVLFTQAQVSDYNKLRPIQPTEYCPPIWMAVLLHKTNNIYSNYLSIGR